ncbi:endonuclease/exonuclease/phosphatase family protein [Sorangium sp. So ce1151]|uniref:endonuclease/exonuclease/phosphatase family protein n=1 Tax=Sorangium sp. So ce1151 TaxID=3133332 RepID=UPI003F602C3E
MPLRRPLLRLSWLLLSTLAGAACATDPPPGGVEDHASSTSSGAQGGGGQGGVAVGGSGAGGQGGSGGEGASGGVGGEGGSGGAGGSTSGAGGIGGEGGAGGAGGSTSSAGGIGGEGGSGGAGGSTSSSGAAGGEGGAGGEDGSGGAGGSTSSAGGAGGDGGAGGSGGSGGAGGDGGAGGSGGAGGGDGETPSTVRVRLMAANLTSGTRQSYDPGHGQRIMQGLGPDIVLIQEFNYGDNGAAEIRAFVDETFGGTFSYYREEGAQIPNGIVSRYPILESGEWDDSSVSNRDFAWARIDIPGPIDLWAVSVHLLTSGSGVRRTEAQQLVATIQDTFPEGDYLVIGGDFNTDNRSEPCISTLSQVVVTSGPYPADRSGNTGTNASRGKPYDWVLVDDDLDPLETAVVIGGSTFASGLVADTRVYSPIDELSPALATDSGATSMQHMGVVRDFLLPADPAPPVDPARADGPPR